MKGLILCAGKGSRLHPLTLSYPKTILPVANKPILYYCIEKLVELDILDIGIVINKSQKKMIKEKLDYDKQWGIRITYIYQNEPKGIADAVRHAKDFIGADPFILLLGDNLITESLAGLKSSIERQESNAAVMLASVKNPQDYGIAEVVDGKIIGIEEKPINPKSNLAVLGSYAFDSTIFKAIDSISPSARGEYEITDALQWIIDHKYSVSSTYTDKHNVDVGTIERWLEANRSMLRNMKGRRIYLAGCTFENTQIIPPVIIERDCEIKDCVIGPYVSIGSDVWLEGCHIENSIILDSVRLKHIPYQIKNSIMGHHSVMAGLPRSSKKVIEH
ncbi:glucose-1-phosphate thymidylyltransferase [Paenibacillus sediminis]|uniref:Glucose-1-phosphate thymidylyltransferase n=1 Tax=Paenibacillus sediminis TaxID=664909 RepID=A0ABS4H5R4_9BACL|nr:glucose-1-phosphate thymidylyltransferase [Paenibacillus sediminis]MBP1937873.1 glucose-1-phosphate thymidylyltransferase [Paenibacillus sediminis]